MRSFSATVSALLLLGVQSAAIAGDKFEKLAIYLEQNLQDEDIEVKFEAVGPGAGLSALKVVAPDGRTVIDFSSGSKLGLQHLVFESPEPKNNGALQADFPEGSYRFTGVTTNGENLQGEARLVHKMPEPIALVRPRADEKNVPLSGLQVRWNPGRNVAGYAIIVEDEKSGRELNASLPASATGFTVPDGFLAPGTEYRLAIGTVSNDRNKTLVETGFTTASRK